MSHRSMILATASYDSTIRLWEAQTGQCYKAIPYIRKGQRTDLHVNKIEITPDKCKLAAACNPNIQLFDVNSNYPHHPIVFRREFLKGIHMVRFTGRKFLADFTSERTFKTNSWQSNNVMAIGFQNDGNMMYSGSEDGIVKIWDLRAPECQKEYGMVSHSQRDNVTASDSKNYYGLVSDSRNYGIVFGCQKEYNDGSSVNTVVLHPNQTELISGDQNGSIRVWDLRTDSCSCELVPEIGKPVQSLSVMCDGTMVVAANNNGTCYVWRCLSGTQTVMTKFEPLHKMQAHNGYILKCLFSPQNKYLATASSDKTVKIWNVDGFKLEKVLIGHQRWVWDCNFSVDGEFLLTASSDMTARLWSMQAGKEVMVYKGHDKATVCCALRD